MRRVWVFLAERAAKLSTSDKIAVVGVGVATALGIAQIILQLGASSPVNANAGKVDMRPRLGLIEDYLDTREGAEKILVKFANRGELPATDSHLHVVSLTNGKAKYVDYFVSPGEILPGQEKTGEGMPLQGKPDLVAFCFRYRSPTGEGYKSEHIYKIDRSSAVAGLSPLKGLTDVNAARVQAAVACQVIPL